MSLIRTLMVVVVVFAPAWLVGAPGVEVINISLDKNCDHDADRLKKAKKADRDVVIWSIVSECKVAHQLTIEPKNMNPFIGCVGDPNTVDIGRPFVIDGATAGKVKLYAVCTVDWQKMGEHKFKIRFAEQTHETVEPRSHEIALDVVP